MKIFKEPDVVEQGSSDEVIAEKVSEKYAPYIVDFLNATYSLEGQCPFYPVEDDEMPKHYL
jgi:hypothetical protein